MEMEGWTLEEAIDEMMAFGFHDYYADLMKYVRSYKPRGYNSGRLVRSRLMNLLIVFPSAARPGTGVSPSAMREAAIAAARKKVRRKTGGSWC
jgi:hypothetical protein